MSLYQKCFSLETTFAPMLCLMSVLCNCTVIGLSVFFFNSFIVALLSIKIAFAVLAAFASANSAFLAFSIFQGQKMQRHEDRLEHRDLEEKKIDPDSSKEDQIVSVRKGRKSHQFYHSLIALNIHQYLTEQVAFVDPDLDLSFISKNKIMRIRNPSVISHIKKGKAMKLICV